jgi:rfaE bifunctional protein kinase chain/domain
LTSVESIFHRFTQTKVLVIGDVMLDTYQWGRIERMSPEVATVPIVDIKRTEHRLGGAANVALNLAALGAQVCLCSLTGQDAEGDELNRLLHAQGIDTTHIIKSPTRPTTVKVRVMDGKQQVLRFDRETREDLTPEEEDRFLSLAEQVITSQGIDVVIFQDYNKGLLTERIIKELTVVCNMKGIATAVDPKSKNFFAYQKVSLFKPNLKEVREAFDKEIDKELRPLSIAAIELQQKLQHKLTLITLSEAGVFISDHAEDKVIPAIARKVVDVSGAGDTVISVAALALAQKLELTLLAQLANIAGGLVCEEVGVVPIRKERFMAEAERLLLK